MENGTIRLREYSINTSDDSSITQIGGIEGDKKR
jgi:hypothetical protein